MALKLYDYQENILETANLKLKEQPSLLIAAPTGAGKTLIIAEILSRSAQRGYNVGLLVHRQELISQSASHILSQSGMNPGIVWRNQKEWDQKITIIAQDTLSSTEIPNEFRLFILIIDEAHHSIAPTWMETIQRLNPRYLIGFSATPFRQDREPLSPTPFAQVIRPITPAELIARKILNPAIIESPVIHDAAGLPQPINQAANIDLIYQHAVEYAIADGRSKIILYVSPTKNQTPSQVMKATTATLNKAGIVANYIDQDISPKKRKEALDRFSEATGASTLVNYIALTEGTDLPCTDCVIIGRHTDSESAIIQMIGRGLRKFEGKTDCLVIDFSGRLDMHDIIHYWRIDQPRASREVRKQERLPGLSTADLNSLISEFPKQLSPLDNSTINYPWFRPYPTKKLLALPLWSAEPTVEKYITIEPTRAGRWKVSKVSLHRTGPAPVKRQQQTTDSPEAAALIVKQALGEQAPMIARSAQWRQNQPSEKQMQVYRRLNPKTNLEKDAITAGEVSDSIACQRFQNRVNPSLL